MELGRLEHLDLRTVWDHEAWAFTPWLADNIDRLSEALGLDLTLVAQEQTVGRYSADILAEDGDGKYVVVENMLAPSDHGHLGQLVTYAAGLDVSYAILVAPEFREEHRSALAWLNDISESSHGFFGVEVSAVRIGDSVPAPLFDVVVRPDNWQRQVREAAAAESSPTTQRNLAWWSEFLDALHERYPGWSNARTPSKDSWMTLPAGRTGVNYSAVIGWTTDRGRHIRVEFYLHDGAAHWETLLAHRSSIDPLITGELSWEELPDAKASRVAVYQSSVVDLETRDDWPAHQDWMLDRLGEFKAAFGPIVPELP